MQNSVRPLAVFLAALAGTFLVFPPAMARDWYVPQQAPTIQAAVDSSLTGDVIVLSPGVYDDCTNLNYNEVPHIAVLRVAITLRGATTDPSDVVLDADGAGRCLEARQIAGRVIVANLTLRAGRATSPFGSGGGILLQNTRAEFHNVVFDSCTADYAGGGLSAAGADLRLEDCLFIGCGTSNVGGAMRLTGGNTRVFGTTIHGTHGPAIHYAEGALAMKRVLITGGDDAAIVRNLITEDPPYISCSNIWGNEENWNDLIDEQLGVSGNLEADPLYCNPFIGDLTLHAASPCAPIQSAYCDLIGARPVVCGGAASVWHLRADGSGDAATIQAALDAAAVGDTLVLAPGVYTGTGNRDLDFGGKNVTVRGEPGDPGRVVIDCEGHEGDPHRGFIFQHGEGRIAVVRDLTVRGGWMADDGAGIWTSASPRLENLVITDNHADRGAGIFCDGGSPLITGCRLVSNEGRWQGGAIAVRASSAEIVDCLVLDNWGKTGGSALLLQEDSDVTVTGSTLWRNGTDPERAAITAEDFSTVTLDHTIVGNNNHLAVRCFDGSGAAAAISNVWGNADGDWTGALSGQDSRTGNLSADPMFCDASAEGFTLRANSMCAADSTHDGVRIGAFAAACAAEGLSAVGDGYVAGAPAGVSCHPNPCNPTTTVRFTLDVAGHARVDVHDAAGRRITTLVESRLNAGPHETVWRGRDRAGRAVATGVYYVRVVTARGAATRPITLLR